MNLKDFFLKAHKFGTQPSSLKALARMSDSNGMSALSVLPESNNLTSTMRQMSSWTPSGYELSGVNNPLLESFENADWIWKNADNNYLAKISKLL